MQHSVTTKEESYSTETGGTGLHHLFGLGFFLFLENVVQLGDREVIMGQTLPDDQFKYQ